MLKIKEKTIISAGVVLLAIAAPNLAHAAVSNIGTKRIIADTSAVCMDGNRATYHYALNTVPTKTWIIHFAGGAACASHAECIARYYTVWGSVGDGSHNLSVPNDSATKDFGSGILSNDATNDAAGIVNPFQDHNKVWVHYCSADMGLGLGGTQTITDPTDITTRDTALANANDTIAAWNAFNPSNPISFYPSISTFTFAGSKIVQAVMNEVLNVLMPVPANTTACQYAPDTPANSEIIIVGSSAGGAMVSHNLDRLRAMYVHKYPSVESSGLRIFGIIDSAHPMGQIETIPTEPAGVVYWKGSNETPLAYDASCAQSRNPTRPWQCMSLSELQWKAGGIGTPFFAVTNAYDFATHAERFNAMTATMFPADILTDPDFADTLRNATTPTNITKQQQVVQAVGKQNIDWVKVVRADPGRTTGFVGAYIPFYTKIGPAAFPAFYSYPADYPYQFGVNGTEFGFLNYHTAMDSPERIRSTALVSGATFSPCLRRPADGSPPPQSLFSAVIAAKSCAFSPNYCSSGLPLDRFVLSKCAASTLSGY